MNYYANKWPNKNEKQQTKEQMQKNHGNDKKHTSFFTKNQKKSSTIRKTCSELPFYNKKTKFFHKANKKQIYFLTKTLLNSLEKKMIQSLSEKMKAN